ncbi:hypothetical protein J2X36_004496 [Methylobacterium sp. BE186]|uniref:hypothetical protein n=1 Tax=Methylobacterium sp. BE186 TaxID=2817715 RepID=UPI0028575B5C|nr:hypothetical protein [Methylobacterium sp. BE186]MDR7039718.1 hypothetical protein [Methylobacterium sp. BE186]
MPYTEGAKGAPIFTFETYHPSRQGLPWLSVCLDPNGRVVAAVSSDTRDKAEVETARCAADFSAKFQMGRCLH